MSIQDFSGKTKNLYVIGIAKDERIRMMFESTFNRRLTEQGIKSTQSYPDLPKDRKADRDTIIEKMQANGADSVLLARVTDQRTKSTFTSVESRYSDRPGPSFSGVKVYDHLPCDNNWNSCYSSDSRAIPQSSTVTKLVILSTESVLCDLQTVELIWLSCMGTGLENNLEAMMMQFVDEAFKKSKVKGLI